LRFKPYLTVEEGEALDLGTVPFHWLLRGYMVAGVVSLLAGFGLLHALVLNPPRLLARESVVSVRPVKLPAGATRIDLVDVSPTIKVVVDDSDDDVVVPPDLLRQCPDIEVTHVQQDGTVLCLPEGSAGVKLLYARGVLRQTLEQEAAGPRVKRRVLEGIMQQGFVPAVTTTPAGAAKDVAARSPLDRYAELVYFFLTFLGVFLRTYWDGLQLRRRRKPAVFTAQTIITSLVLAIAVYVVVIQSGLVGTSKMLTFSTGIFAVYNGLVSHVLLKDIAAFRANTTATPP
jgi:hypothetical protein